MLLAGEDCHCTVEAIHPHRTVLLPVRAFQSTLFSAGRLPKNVVFCCTTPVYGVVSRRMACRFHAKICITDYP